jgi:hypothetical protein
MAEKKNQHVVEIENAMLFGKKGTDLDKDGKVFYTMD